MTNSQPAPEQKPVEQNPAPASSKDIIKGETVSVKENMMLAGMCALVGTAGIRHFVHS